MLQHIIFDAENGGFAEGYSMTGGSVWSDYGRYYQYSDGCIHHHDGVDYTDVVSEAGFYIAQLIDLDSLPINCTKLCFDMSVVIYKYAASYSDTLAAFGIRYGSKGVPDVKHRTAIDVRTDVVGGNAPIVACPRTIVEMDLTEITERQFYIVVYSYYANARIHKIYLEGEDPNDTKYEIHASDLIPIADEVRRLTGTTDLLTVDEMIAKLQSLAISSSTGVIDFQTITE